MNDNPATPNLSLSRVPIYVAASSKERDRYRSFVERLPKGFDVTYNWANTFDRVEEQLASGAIPALTRADLSLIGATCFRGVEAGAVFVLLVPTTPSRGAWVELGMAIAMASRKEKLQVLTIGGDAAGLDCWVDFARHTHAETEEQAIEVLGDLVDRINAFQAAQLSRIVKP